MKCLVICFTLVLVFSARAASQTQKKNGAEQEIRTTVHKWAEAVVGRDMVFLEKLFADDLFITTYDGKTRGKAEELAILKPSPDVKTVSVVNEDLRVKVYGKTAVVTATTKMHFVIAGRDVHTALRYTAVFVKKQDRWQMAALQTARAPQPKAN